MARNHRSPEKEKKEYEEKLLEIRRVTKVTRGGRRLSFRATVLIGNRKGKIGVGTGKGSDVSIAVRKAVHDAYKNIRQVNITKGGSILYPVAIKNKASVVKLMPAAPGTGLKAGSSVRLVLELAGYTNLLSKIVGSNNKLNNALTTIELLTQFKLKESHKSSVMSEADHKEEAKREKAAAAKDEKKETRKKPAPKKAAPKKETKTVKTEEVKEVKEEKQEVKEEKKEATETKE